MAATRVETFVFRVKAVGVAATAAVPEGRACTDGSVKEPLLDIICTLDTSIIIKLTPGCKHNTHIYYTPTTHTHIYYTLKHAHTVLRAVALPAQYLYSSLFMERLEKKKSFFFFQDSDVADHKPHSHVLVSFSFI